MKTLLSTFLNASESFRNANPAILTPKTNQNSLAVTAGGKKRAYMTKPESEFAMILESRKRNGEIRDYLFHPLSLPWAEMKYTPDFMVTPNSGLEKRKMIEVKGPHIHYRQQALARFKGARAWWPEFTFELWQRQKTGWKQII